MQRIVVIGTSGSGKSTLAHRLAVAIDAPVSQLDALFHQPDWTPLPVERMRGRVAEIAAGERWVVDGNYAMVRDIVWEAADVIVWLDLPKWLAMSRITRRTLSRGITKRGLWNGNTEDWRNAFRWGPTENMIRWTWTTHADRHWRYGSMQAGEWAHKRWVRLRSRREIEGFAASVESQATR
ncbi:MAG TPA: adenylate kinase [Acidimicrobiia bacterium]|jgi:adenylate kinase family enzyme|nr:adenylate kinase [Acidimicrobiia bacterium]